MPIMRSLSSDTRLQALSVPEITEAFEQTTLAIGRAHEFNRRKLKPGPLLNAIVLHFLNLGEDEQKKVAGEWLARLELLLAESEDERVRAMDRIPPDRPVWNPGAVRSQEDLHKPRKPPQVSETKVDPDLPKPNKRRGAG